MLVLLRTRISVVTWKFTDDDWSQINPCCREEYSTLINYTCKNWLNNEIIIYQRISWQLPLHIYQQLVFTMTIRHFRCQVFSSFLSNAGGSRREISSIFPTACHLVLKIVTERVTLSHRGMSFLGSALCWETEPEPLLSSHRWRGEKICLTSSSTSLTCLSRHHFELLWMRVKEYRCWP